MVVGHVEVALLLVQGGHLGHLFFAQLEIEDFDVFLDMVGVRRAGHHAEAFLDVPADDGLGCTFAVGFRNRVDDRVAEDLALRVAATEREPALNLDVVFLNNNEKSNPMFHRLLG